MCLILSCLSAGPQLEGASGDRDPGTRLGGAGTHWRGRQAADGRETDPGVHSQCRHQGTLTLMMFWNI